MKGWGRAGLVSECVNPVVPGVIRIARGSRVGSSSCSVVHDVPLPRWYHRGADTIHVRARLQL